MNSKTWGFIHGSKLMHNRVQVLDDVKLTKFTTSLLMETIHKFFFACQYQASVISTIVCPT